MLTNIPIDQLYPHPQNPRKALGDLTELADSIRAAGILQNLTVVPHPGNGAPADESTYRVVIGHRRLAAAKLAGLDELPCAIADMDKQTQISTMLLENMQRSDLTPVEQAEGFQLMLDFGEDVESIAQKTGFSESTVRRRVKLLDLDRDKLLEAEQRGGTLQDYAELEQIKDPTHKNEVLDAIGTNNFNFALRRALDDEQTEARKRRIETALDAFATAVENRDGYDVIRTIPTWRDPTEEELAAPDDLDENAYFYCYDQYRGYLLMLQADDQEDDPDDKEHRQQPEALQACLAQLEELSDRTYQLRKEFVQKYPGYKKDGQFLMTLATRYFVSDSLWPRADDDLFEELIGIDLVQGEDEDDDLFEDRLATAVSNATEVHPEKALLAAVYCSEFDSSGLDYYDCDTAYSANPKLDKVYAALTKLGYRMSDEEKALQDGSHELYAREDK